MLDTTKGAILDAKLDDRFGGLSADVRQLLEFLDGRRVDIDRVCWGQGVCGRWQDSPGRARHYRRGEHENQ